MIIIIVVVVFVSIAAVAAAPGRCCHLWSWHNHRQLVHTATTTSAVRKLSTSHGGNSEDRATHTSQWLVTREITWKLVM